MSRFSEQWARLYEQKSNELKEENCDDALHIKNLETLQQNLEHLSVQYQQDNFAQVLGRLNPTLHHLESFSAAISSASQYDPTACLVWGVLQAVIKAGCLSKPDILQSILTLVSELNESLPELKSYTELFSGNPELQIILQDMYDAYIDYYLEVLHYVKRNLAVNYFRSLFTSSPQQALQRAQERVKTYVKQFRRTATLIHRQSQKQNHEEIEKILASASLTGNLGQQPSPEGNVEFPVSTMYLFRNYNFCGRGDIVQRMEKVFAPPSNTNADDARSRGPACCVLYGLGGIGKTQIALEYSYLNRSNYDGLFWVQAEQDMTLKSSFASIAEKLHLTTDIGSSDGQNQSRAIERTRDWLRTTERKWLLIFDNVEDFEDLSPYIPESTHSFSGIVITTQMASVYQITEIYTSIEVTSLSREVGAELLFRNMKKSALDEEEQATAQELSELLEGFPLALSTIGGYLSQSNTKVREFLENLKMSSSAWVSNAVGQVKQYEKTLATVFEIALKELKHEARALLNILAFLNPDEVPEELILNNVGRKPLEFLKNKTDLPDIVGDLRRRQLIRRDRSGAKPYLSIHRTVQWNVLLDLSKDYKHRWQVFNQAFMLLRQGLPEISSIDNPEPKLWAQFQKYVPQILTVRSHCLWPEPPVELPEDFAQVLSDLSTYMWHAGIFKDGAEALRTAERILDDNEIDEKNPLRGNIHEHLGIFASFEGVSERQEAMDRREKALHARKASLESVPQSRMTREDEIRRFNVESDMAFGLMQVEDFERCETVIEKCHEKYQTWGSEDDYPFEYLKYNHIISYVRMHQQQPVQAIDHCKKGVLLGHKCAGPDHPMTQLVKFSLGNHLYLAGELDESLKLQLDVLQFRTQVCGKFNHLTLESHSMCGALLVEKKQYEDACHHLLQCLDRRKRHQWNEEGVARSRYFYAKALEGLGRKEEAQRELSVARKIKDRYLRDYPKFTGNLQQIQPRWQ